MAPDDLLALREVGADAEFHLISGVGHGLQNLLQPGDPPDVDPRVLERIDGFLGSVRVDP